IDPELAIRSGLSSGEGVIAAVQDPVKEGDGCGVVGVLDKRLLIVEGEFGGVLQALKREGNKLSSILRNAWDHGNIATLTKVPIVATGAQIAIIGHITHQELARHLDEVEVFNGFVNRFIIFCAKRSKCLPRGGSVPPKELASITTKLKAARLFARNNGTIEFDQEAGEAWDAVYPALTQD